MGKGDRRTKRGKIWRKTYGKTRPRMSNRRKASPPAASEDKGQPAPEAGPDSES
jgi:30S ribosomal protein S31